jgi:hypothetical protein
MPRITKAHMKESIVSFANDSITIIKEKLNLHDMDNREDIPSFEKDGWYYYLHKSVTNVKPEIRVRRQNYRQGNTQYYKDQPKGNRINEDAWIYKEGMNRTILGRDNGETLYGRDDGFIIDGLSVQDYTKNAF